MSLFTKRAGRVDKTVITVLAAQQVSSVASGMGFSKCIFLTHSPVSLRKSHSFIGCAHIFITSAAPTRNSLGATVGLSQSLVSFIRATGPAATASLFAFSLQHNLLGGQLVYVVLVLVVLLVLAIASYLPKVIKRASDPGEG
jgi:hypothetical protein